MEQRIPHYYKMALFDVGFVFSLCEERTLQEGEYHKEETREIPVYRLEQKEKQVVFGGTNYEENYIGQQLKAGTINACNSFGKDKFFYDEEKKIVFYASTFIYAERKNDTLYDLVTGSEIPKYAIEQMERVATVEDYIQLRSNVQAIEPYVDLYQKQFIDILISNANRKGALARLQTKGALVEKIERTLEDFDDTWMSEQRIDYKKEVVDSGIQNKIDTYMKKIEKKRR